MIVTAARAETVRETALESVPTATVVLLTLRITTGMDLLLLLTIKGRLLLVGTSTMMILEEDVGPARLLLRLLQAGDLVLDLPSIVLVEVVVDETMDVTIDEKEVVVVTDARDLRALGLPVAAVLGLPAAAPPRAWKSASPIHLPRISAQSLSIS